MTYSNLLTIYLAPFLQKRSQIIFFSLTLRGIAAIPASKEKTKTTFL